MIRRGRKPKFTDEIKAQIPGWVAAGLTNKEMADRAGFTESTLIVRCSQSSISLKRPPDVAPIVRAKTRVERLIEERGGPVLVPPFPLPANRQSLRLNLDPHTVIALKLQAAKMGMTISEIITKLLETVAKDNLYDAVIDEAA